MSRGTTRRKRIVVAELVEDVAAAARLAANVRRITLSVSPVDDEIAIDGDEQILTAVLGNLLQNATKFSRPNSE